MPPLIFEGDDLPVRSLSGPGRAFITQPAPVVSVGSRSRVVRDLPASYGANLLYLTARDPHALFAYWDFAPAEVRRALDLSVDGHLTLRVHLEEVTAKPFRAIVLPEDARSWLVKVRRAGATFVAELGYHDRSGTWRSLAISDSAATPPDRASAEMGEEFATFPVEVPLAKLLEQVKEVAETSAPLVEAIAELRQAGHEHLPDLRADPPPAWTPRQERALAEITRVDADERVWVSSIDVTELLGQPPGPAGKAAPGQAGAVAASPAGGFGAEASGPSSGEVGQPQPPTESDRAFWLTVNAELVVYGATAPGATVTIGGRSIRLRPDGSFSLRFALPDGEYDLPLAALSPDGVDERSARLRFSRGTTYRGTVGKRRRENRLKPPQPENVEGSRE